MTVEVLVTGASGVLGREVVAVLRSRSFRVLAATRTPREGSDCAWDVACQAVPEPDCRPSVVVHCAARTGRLREPYTETVEYFDVNVMGTLKVADWCLSRGVRRLVLVSGAIVYGQWDNAPKTESDAVNPWVTGPYGASKACAEHAARIMTYAGRELTILRLSSLYGPGYGRSLIPRLLEEGKSSGTVRVSTPLTSFDLCHVVDAAHAVAEAVGANGSGLWNVGSGRLTTIRDLAEICAECVGAEVIVSEGPADQVTRTINWVDDSSARRDLRHCNTVSLASGIAEIAEYFVRGLSDASASRR